MDMPTIVLLLLVPLAVWRIYSRLKRLMGRNKSELWRHAAYATVAGVTLAVLAVVLIGKWQALAALLVGAAVGAALGHRNMKLTRLQNTAEGFFYTQNRRFGLLVTMLFFGRLIYRLFEAYLHMHDQLPLDPDFIGHPLTAVVFGLTAGFWGCYHLLLLRWRRAVKPVPRPIDIFDIK
ncbi:hypothetical protein [Duganella violaceipulchra]|uniref:Small-conductance mechanosensitive channel n=1 Tax=Duganella violaceipulchra TaxID=2849652 RepID=A0AA41H6W6_9BURK|nr:hypothetical protein [Duganella violaceicalia]MBV6321585.1 hypothetical protein [Duganella violaceicalia]MCP2008155.1 small-conductance mechanosensitive channel [Duganella violaceicalia]